MQKQRETRTTIILGVTGAGTRETALCLAKRIARRRTRVLLADCEQPVVLPLSVARERRAGAKQSCAAMIVYQGVHCLNHGDHNAFVLKALLPQLLTEHTYDLILVSLGACRDQVLLTRCTHWLVLPMQETETARLTRIAKNGKTACLTYLSLSPGSAGVGTCLRRAVLRRESGLEIERKAGLYKVCTILERELRQSAT